jgi:hypothetical protein
MILVDILDTPGRDGASAFATLYLSYFTIPIWCVVFIAWFLFVKKKKRLIKQSIQAQIAAFLIAVIITVIMNKPSGIDAELVIKNISDFDIKNVVVITDTGQNIISSRNTSFYYIDDHRGNARGHGRHKFVSSVPESICISYREISYNKNSKTERDMGPLTVNIHDYIPGDVINKTKGWSHDTLVIEIALAQSKRYLRWFLYPTQENHNSSVTKEPIQSGGDTLPPISIKRKIFISLYNAYKSGEENAKATIEKAHAEDVDLNQRYRGLPLLPHVLKEPGNGWYASLLLDAGVDPNLVDFDSLVTPLMLASGEGDAALVSHLLTLNIDINQTNVKGSSALMYAAKSGQLDIVKLLLAAGADKTINNHGAITAAQQQSYKEIVELLNN